MRPAGNDKEEDAREIDASRREEVDGHVPLNGHDE